MSRTVLYDAPLRTDNSYTVRQIAPSQSVANKSKTSKGLVMTATRRVSRRAPTAPSTEQDGFITRADAAKFASLNIQTIDQMIREGRLRAYRVGRRVLLRCPDLVAAITAEEL